MSDPQPQLTLETYRDQMIAAVRSSGESVALADSADWADLALEAIRRLADVGRNFTADDLADVCGPAPSPGASGAVFRIAAGRGLIERVGYSPSRRLSRHGSVIATWRGRRDPSDDETWRAQRAGGAW